MQNLASVNTPIKTQIGTASALVQAQYRKLMLMGVAPATIYDTYAQAMTLETNGNTKKLFARRYKELLPATTPLAEYDGTNIKDPEDVEVEEVEIALDHFGAYIVVTDENELYNFDKIKKKYAKLQKKQVKRTSEEIIRAKVYNGTAVHYAGGVATQALAANEKMTATDFETIIDSLTQQGAEVIEERIKGSTKVSTEPINEAFISIVHHSMRFDLEKIPGFVKAINYGNQEKLPGEFGSFDKIRFIEDREGRTALSGTVLQGIVFGADAFATLTLKGSKNLSVLLKDKKDIGGPLEQFSTVGWKMILGAGILNENWLIRYEAQASITQSAKTYFGS